MNEDLRKQLEAVGKGGDDRIFVFAFSNAFNRILDAESWYDEDVWTAETVQLKELRELNETSDGELTDSMRRRRARLRIEAAFPGVFRSRASRSLLLSYAGFEFPSEIAVDESQFTVIVNQYVVPFIVDTLLGSLIGFVGILVTAHIIPDLLRPGSLHLLLSKPISRPMLLISKFFGGCAFVFLCVSQLVVGIYLIAGLRLDVWNLRMLWCIPVSVFVFAVYYSVSVLAGLLWRSSIVAIAISLVFWLFCFIAGIAGGVFDEIVSGPDALTRVVPMENDQMVATTRGGGLKRYDVSSNQGIDVLPGNGFDRILSPITLDSKYVLTANVRGGRFNPYGMSASDLLVIGERTNWAPEPALKLPRSTESLVQLGPDHIVAINASGLSVTEESIVLDAFGEQKDSEGDDEEATNEDEEGDGNWLAKLQNMMGAATEGFQPILPSQVTIAPPRFFVISQSADWMIVISGMRVTRLVPDGDLAKTWKVEADSNLEGDFANRIVAAVSGDVLMVARAEQPLHFYDAKTLEKLSEAELDESLAPTGCQRLNDGRFLLLTSDARCRVVDVTSTEPSVGSPIAYRDVESIQRAPKDGPIYLVHNIDSVDVLDAATLEVTREIRPSVSNWRMIDRYIVAPLRMVIPQTGELGETTAAMVSGKKAVEIERGPQQGEFVQYNVFRPVVSCGGFIVFMLGISCFYFWRRDF